MRFSDHFSNRKYFRDGSFTGEVLFLKGNKERLVVVLSKLKKHSCLAALVLYQL